MASEFDESLVNFLAVTGSTLTLRAGKQTTRGAPQGWVFAVEIDPGPDGTIGEGRSPDLDDAINEAVVTMDLPGLPGPLQNNPEDDLQPNRVWSTAYKNSLPDSAFLFIKHDCVEYKEAGRSHPLDCRDLPVKNRSGAYDYEHVKNAISRAVQLKGVPVSVQKKLQRKAREIFNREFGYAETD